MAAHSTVTYVEPNMSNQDWQVKDNLERTPRLEDYCIAMNIEVEVSSRDSQLSINDGDKEVLILQWNNSDGTQVSFMGGTKIGGYEYNGLSRSERLKNTDLNLTTYYADMYVGDLIHYGTTEMLGIKSVNIEYAKSCVPMITVQFTDVRGLSLFQPTELSRDNSYNGIKGLNKDNVAQSFFQCFFKMPLPKFTIYLKGFYGQPVAYVCMCDKFDTNFNSDTGDFDVTAHFIGYSYSFMTDVSLDALIAAPYSDFFGKDYWESNKKNGRFVIPDKLKTHEMPMPTLYELYEDFKDLLKKSNSEMEHTTLTEEEKNHQQEISDLNEIRGQYQLWYQQLYEVLKEKYGKRYVFDFRDGKENDADWYRMLILTNSRTKNDLNLSGDYEQYPDDFKKVTNDLYSAIETFNKKGYSYKKLKNVSKDFSEYTRKNVFNDCYLNRNTRKIEFGGFSQDNRLNRTQLVNRLFHNSMVNVDVKENAEYRDYTLSTIYNDGIDQYKDAFVIEVDYSEIKRRVLALQNHAKKSDDEKEREAKRKEHNRIMLANMNWYPSVENFTKIMMAHLETFMMMMYNVAESCSDRKPSDLGITIGKEGNAVDVNENAGIVPPFPRVVKTEIGDDGIPKKVDSWVGEYENGKSFIEADMINGLFNAVDHIQQLLRESMEVEVQENTSQTMPLAMTVKHPLTPFDFHATKNIYGTDVDISNNPNAFVGKVAMRMFDILSISNFRKQYPTKITNTNGDFIKKLGTIEAENFYDNVKITNNNLLGLLGVDGDKGTIDSSAILQCVKNNAGIGGNTDIPWKYPNSNKGLFGEDMWLTRYVTSYSKNSTTYIYPMQNMSFSKLDDTLAIFNKDSSSIEPNNEDIAVSWIEGSANAKSLLESTNDSCFGSVFICDDHKVVVRALDNANSSGNNAYKDIYDWLNYDSVLDSERFGEMIYSDGVFVPKLGIITNEKRCEFTKKDKFKNLYVAKNDNSNLMQCVGGKIFTYQYDVNAIPNYISEADNEGIVSWFLSECRGFDKYLGTSYRILSDRSFLEQPDYEELINSADGWEYCDNDERKIGFLLMGFEAIDYNAVAKHLDSDESFTYVPKLAALQMGAALASMNSIEDKITLESITKCIFVPSSFSKIFNYLNRINRITRIAYIKYFKKWVNNYKADINKNLFNMTYHIACTYEVGDYVRALFKEDTEYITSLSNNLMSIVLITKGNVNHFFGVSKKGLEFDDSVATVYLDGFLSRLRELYGIKEQPTGGDAVKLVKSSTKTSEDMKKELYRYLKLVYDKWIPAMGKKSWEFETFFPDLSGDTSLIQEGGDGHLFHFIDSFYNKIGDKLLINPMKLCTKISAVLQANDVNTMMLGFMADIYSQNKCMMMCLQNFQDFGTEEDAMGVMFKPIPYREMKKPHKHPDFVIVYPYEPSKYLNVDNGEFNNDAFMLNDEFETPLAIKSRGGNKDTFYQTPAFGVSYGKQYQSYFKKVSVGMSSPIATQQAILAKHAILRDSQDTTRKGVVAQDLYDIYATQSYTCKVEMLGCAWVQPLMYFVLTNVPMFRGSYLIFKVNHKITPGNMITEFQGCRMANVSNKLVEDIFTDEDFDSTPEPYLDNKRYELADVDNDCPYQVFPLFEETTFSSSASLLEKAKVVMDILISKMTDVTDENKKRIIAAGIAGNMAVETAYSFDPNTVNPRDKYAVAAGLVQWNDDYYTLRCMLENNYGNYGFQKYKTKYVTKDDAKKVKELLKTRGLDYQCTFLIKSMRDNAFNRGNNKWTDLWKTLKAQTKPDNVAELFCKIYENPDLKTCKMTDRQNKAKDFYNYYRNASGSKTSQPDKDVKEDIYKALYEAVQKSINSTKRAFNLAKMEKWGDRIMMFKQADGKNDKLPLVFDILLNGYYEYVQNLWWVSPSNDFKSNPMHIDVIPAQKPKPEERTVLAMVTQQANNALDIRFGDDNTSVNLALLKSIFKKYRSQMDNKDLNIKEIPQFDNKEIFRAIDIQNCTTLGSNNSMGEIVVCDDVKCALKDGMIGDWNVQTTINWFKKYSRDSYKDKKCKPGAPIIDGSCVGRCWGYVKRALQAGGFPFANSEAAYQAKSFLLENGFKCIRKGFVDGHNGSDYPDKCVGDITVFEACSGHKYGHIDMWSGSKWVSDFWQEGNWISGTAKTGFKVFRYTGVGKK